MSCKLFSEVLFREDGEVLFRENTKQGRVKQGTELFREDTKQGRNKAGKAINMCFIIDDNKRTLLWFVSSRTNYLINRDNSLCRKICSLSVPKFCTMDNALFKPQRKSYIKVGEIYFWTATIHKWIPLLKEKIYKEIVIESLEFLSRKQKIDVFAFVIMPNHIHLIW